MGDWYDKEGNRISMHQWGALHDEEDYIRVGLDEIGPYVVSTVWIGLDHSFTEHGPPIIFETLVFTSSAWHDTTDRDDPDHESLSEIDGKRYSTLQEAQEGHEETVLLVRATLDTEGPLGPQNGDSEGSEA